MPKTVNLPVNILDKMKSAISAFDEFQDELEDYLLNENPAFLAKMRRARKQHILGKTQPLEKLKKSLCIK